MKEDIKKLKDLPYEALEARFEEYLESVYTNLETIKTALNDGLYILKHDNKPLFWEIILDPDFDKNFEESFLEFRKTEPELQYPPSNLGGYKRYMSLFREFIGIK